MEAPRRFAIAKLSIRKLGSSPVLIITHEDPSLRIESFAIVITYVVCPRKYTLIDNHPHANIRARNFIGNCLLILGAVELERKYYHVWETRVKSWKELKTKEAVKEFVYVKNA